MEHSDYLDRQGRLDRKVRSMSMDIVRRGAVDTKRRSVTIAANDRARTSPEIDLAGLRFDNYRRNPGRDVGARLDRTLTVGRAAHRQNIEHQSHCRTAESSPSSSS